MDSNQDSAGRTGRRRARSKKGAAKAGAPAKSSARGPKGHASAKGGKGPRGGGRGQRAEKRTKSSEYFMKPAKQGAVSVFRRPCGNRIEPKLCGTMSSRASALALVRQLERAESVVKDLFLEATDDGIEALEEILRISRESVERRNARQHQRHPGSTRVPAADAAPAVPREDGDPAAADPYAMSLTAPGDLSTPDEALDPSSAADPAAPAADGAPANRRRRPRPRRPRTDRD